MQNKIRKFMLVITVMMTIFGNGVIQANSRSNPAYLNEPVTIRWSGKTIELELLETYRTLEPDGKNPYSTIPPGHEILMAKFRLKVSQGTDALFDGLFQDFQAISGRGFPIDNRVLVVPKDPLKREFYGNQELTGWVSVVVEKDDKRPLVVYERNTNREMWFSTAPKGWILAQKILQGNMWGTPFEFFGGLEFLREEQGEYHYVNPYENPDFLGFFSASEIRYRFFNDSLCGLAVRPTNQEHTLTIEYLSYLFGDPSLVEGTHVWTEQFSNVGAAFYPPSDTEPAYFLLYDLAHTLAKGRYPTEFQWNTFQLEFEVPSANYPQTMEVVLLDGLGLRKVFGKRCMPGETVNTSIDFNGDDARVAIFIDGKLVHDGLASDYQ